MTEEKRLFLQRLTDLVNELGYPEHGRQTQLAAHYKVTQGAARKWFAAETMPGYEICADLCKRAQVQYEWLMTGRGPKYLSSPLQSETSKISPAAQSLIDEIIKIENEGSSSPELIDVLSKVLHVAIPPASDTDYSKLRDAAYKPK